MTTKDRKIAMLTERCKICFDTLQQIKKSNMDYEVLELLSEKLGFKSVEKCLEYYRREL